MRAPALRMQTSTGMSSWKKQEPVLLPTPPSNMYVYCLPCYYWMCSLFWCSWPTKMESAHSLGNLAFCVCKNKMEYFLLSVQLLALLLLSGDISSVHSECSVYATGFKYHLWGFILLSLHTLFFFFFFLIYWYPFQLAEIHLTRVSYFSEGALSVHDLLTSRVAHH